MFGGQAFEHIDRGRNRLALAVLHRLGQIQLVEEHVAQLLRRIDVELSSAVLVDLVRFGVDLALQARRHFSQSCTIDLDSGLFHARQHRNQRQIDFVVELEQAGVFDFATQCGGQAAGDVGRFGQRPAKLQIEAAQRDVGQTMR